MAEIREKVCKLEKDGRRQEEVGMAVENWENAGGEHRAGYRWEKMGGVG